MLNFDPTITPQGIATLLAVLSAWLIPVTTDLVKKNKRRKYIKNNIALYLDIMEMKTRLAIYEYFQPGKKLPTGKNTFENQNKANHDIIERMALSEDLNSNEREELLKYIRYYKNSREMKEEEEFKEYLNKVQNTELRKLFMKAPSLEEEINRVIENKRVNNNRKI